MDNESMNINYLLPPEILSIVFSFLSIKEKFSCVRVCKKWREIILNLKLRDLVIAQDHLPINEKWSFSFERVDCTNSIINLNLNLIENLLKKKVFLNLKSLYIYTISLSYLTSNFIETLNRFIYLERLELPLILLRKGKTILNLSYLNVLTLKKVHGGFLELRTPRMTKLHIQSSCFGTIKFVNPQALKYLHCAEYDDHIKELINLEFLYCSYISNLNENFLRELSCLKQIHFEHDSITFYNLLNQKRIYNRIDLKIYYQGLNNLKYLEKNLNYGSDALNKENIEIYLANYANLADHFFFIHYIDYNSWQEVEEDNKYFIPLDFIRKFVNLNAIFVNSKVNDEYKFIDFLNSCYDFSFLKLNYSTLRPEFYTKIPLLCPKIRNLEIKEDSYAIEKLNFNFIFRLPFLTNIITNKQISIEFAYQTFKRLKYLSTFTLSNKNNEIRIKIHFFTNLFEVCLGEEIYFFDNIDNMYSFLKECDF